LTRMSTRITSYKLIAFFLATVGCIAFLGCALVYYSHLSYLGLSTNSADWGTFGDFVSGLAGTVIALLTLCALAFTLHLQATELAETRAALSDQARTAEQLLQLTLQIEQRRVRPRVQVQGVREAKPTRVAKSGPAVHRRR